MDATLLANAITAIDAAHATDPAGKEQAYADSVEVWMDRLLGEDYDSVARLAARCQHLERWAIPRDSYPMDRPSYHKWRQAVHARQGERAEEILTGVGIDTEVASRINGLVAKHIKRDADPLAQALEDAACLVFLDEQIADFAADHADYDEDRWLRILRRTWAKMSDPARDLALSIAMPDAIRQLVVKAVAG